MDCSRSSAFSSLLLKILPQAGKKEPGTFEAPELVQNLQRKTEEDLARLLKESLQRQGTGPGAAGKGAEGPGTAASGEEEEGQAGGSPLKNPKTGEIGGPKGLEPTR